MFGVFPIMRTLHELLWYLTEALTLDRARPLHGALKCALEETERLTRNSPDELLALDLAAHQQALNALLLRTSQLVRDEVRSTKQEYRGADLIGANLKGADLRGANLRGACLIRADLSKADLRMADLLGADCRDSDLRGADLRGSIFLIQSQLDAAQGDRETKLPPSFTRPVHWWLV